MVTDYCSECIDLTTCTKCQFPYILGPSGTCEFCESGFERVDTICTNITGCQSFLPDYSKCIACLTIYNFDYVNSKADCTCKVGHKLGVVSGKKACVSICGDGITSIPSEKCDDGNLRSGDGCDENCNIEKNYICTPASPSQCIFTFNITELKYNYAYRVEKKNKCKFSFSVLPFHEIFRYMGW